MKNQYRLPECTAGQGYCISSSSPSREKTDRYPYLCALNSAWSGVGTDCLHAVLVLVLLRSGGKDENMKYTYKTATEAITIDVSEEWVSLLQDCDRMEYNNDHTETRRHYHLEACEYEGADFVAENDMIERLIESDDARHKVEPALDRLTPSQRQMIEALFYRDMTAKEYADSRGVSKSFVSKEKVVALKKIKKYLENG